MTTRSYGSADFDGSFTLIESLGVSLASLVEDGFDLEGFARIYESKIDAVLAPTGLMLAGSELYGDVHLTADEQQALDDLTENGEINPVKAAMAVVDGSQCDDFWKLVQDYGEGLLPSE